ncbi:hypothetical protein, partial [Staphylococcus aureus]|uniref:hypothetical protein n=1 Tax=Staphylococcus aureus TaxID=1280 RepID=UPI0039BDC2A0
NGLYHTNRHVRTIPVVHLAQPGQTSAADFYSTPHIEAGPTLTLTYTLVHPRSLPVHQVIGMYSLDGGGHWSPAAPAGDTRTTNLSSSPRGTVHTYSWDMYQSGVLGLSDNVVFRLIAIPAIAVEPNQTPGPYLYGSYGTASYP